MPRTCSKHTSCLSTLTFGEGTTTPLLVLTLLIAAPVYDKSPFPLAAVLSPSSGICCHCYSVLWSEASHTRHHRCSNCSIYSASSLTARRYALCCGFPRTNSYSVKRGQLYVMLSREPKPYSGWRPSLVWEKENFNAHIHKVSAMQGLPMLHRLGDSSPNCTLAVAFLSFASVCHAERERGPRTHYVSAVSSLPIPLMSCRSHNY